MTSAEATVTPNAVAEIPVHLTPFVGRERELGDLVPLLGQARLLTLTGAGGSGKTRLAVELATRSSSGRLTWVDLAPLSDAALVSEQVALSLRANDRAGASPTDAIIAALREAPTLLVLDNCEHVVDEVAGLVAQLLRACQSVRVLATSREALGVPGETAWLVPPLATEEANALFFDRARAANPMFRPADGRSVETICNRLDGIPLAIELAAARARVLSAEQIAERLDDAFRLLNSGSRTAIPRQRTLRGTMDWSFDLLSGRERALLRRLAVFAGPFSLDAAEAICVGEPLAPEDILDGVAALVDKSLVMMEPRDDEAAYRLLETVRQYALEKLDEAGEGAATRRAHADHYVAFIETAEPYLFGGGGDMQWIGRVAHANGNLRAAALWCERHDELSTLALRINTAMNWFWFATGQLGEAKQRLTSALARPSKADDRLRGRALLAVSNIALWQGDHAALGSLIDQCLALLDDGVDGITRASALSIKGASLLLRGDPAAAAPFAEQALAVARTQPPHVIQSFALYWRGWIATARGDHELARNSLEEAIAIGRQIRNNPSISHPLALLGRLAVARGDHGEAFHHFSEALEIHHEIGDMWGMAIDFEGLVPVFMKRDRMRRAARLIGVADAVREKMSSRLSPAEMEQREALYPELERELDGSLEALIAEGRALPLADAIRLATTDDDGITGVFRVPSYVPQPLPVPPSVRLRVDVLGPMQVSVGGKPVESTAWGSARPRELLVMLLMQPDGCTKEQIGLAFWPEASTAQLRNNFHVTLHRLRKALGHADWITLAHERYRVDPAVIESFDVVAFEREARAALDLLKRDDPGAIACLERATALYRGDLLDGEPAGDWHGPHRDRLQQLFVECLMALGEAHSRLQRHAKAIEVYRRVLVRDAVHEDAVRALMSVLEQSGDRAAALRVFERFVERLKQELKAAPSATITALYRRLQGAS